MFLLLLYVSIAIGVSFLCSVMEAVILSISPSYIGVLEEQGSPHAKRLAELKADVDRPLAAILSLNTVAHTIGATLAGAQAVTVFGEAWLGVISVILTLLILIASEIIPKTLGALYWRALAVPVARLLKPTMTITAPLVYLSRLMTQWLSRGREPDTMSREEITALADIGKAQGTLAEDESRMLKNMMRFQSVRVWDVMTPRTVAFMLQRDVTVGDVMRDHPDIRFSRIPLIGKRSDEVTGYVLKDDILIRASRGETDLPLSALERSMQVVPDLLPLSVVLERLLERREHIALVIDEFGGTEGVVTLEDVIETLLGLEIVDEVDSVTDMQALAREKWRERARTLGLAIDAVPGDDASEGAEQVASEGDAEPTTLGEALGIERRPSDEPGEDAAAEDPSAKRE